MISTWKGAIFKNGLLWCNWTHLGRDFMAPNSGDFITCPLEQNIRNNFSLLSWYLLHSVGYIETKFKLIWYFFQKIRNPTLIFFWMFLDGRSSYPNILIMNIFGLLVQKLIMVKSELIQIGKCWIFRFFFKK